MINIIISYNQTLDESGGKKEHVKSQLYLGLNLLSTITKAMYHYSLVLFQFLKRINILKILTLIVAIRLQKCL